MSHRGHAPKSRLPLYCLLFLAVSCSIVVTQTRPSHWMLIPHSSLFLTLSPNPKVSGFYLWSFHSVCSAARQP